MKRKFGIVFIILNLISCVYVLSIKTINVVTNKGVFYFSSFQNYEIASGSMYPTLKKGDYVVVIPIEDELEISIHTSNDLDGIYLYKDRDSNKIIIHRLVGINSDGTYIFWGDANATKDEQRVTKDEIIGKLSKVSNINYDMGMIIAIINMTAIAITGLIVLKGDKRQITLNQEKDE